MERGGAVNTNMSSRAKRRTKICLFKVHSVSLKQWSFLAGTGELKEKRIHCFFKGGGRICRIIWQGTSVEAGKIGRAGFCPALESEPPWLSFSALVGRGC